MTRVAIHSWGVSLAEGLRLNVANRDVTNNQPTFFNILQHGSIKGLVFQMSTSSLLNKQHHGISEVVVYGRKVA